MKPNPSSQHGFSLIELLIVVAIIGIIAAIAIPYLNQAKQASQSASAIASLRTINSAQNSYRQATGQFGTLNELGNANYIADPSLSAGRKSDYSFSVTNQSNLDYEANADPIIDPNNAYQHYYINATGVIRIEVGAPATASSNPMQ
ncbi:MAG TPA: prepilin-type N-terminal cleavage/methylation domain-containing protein [Pyrinomonadaceae bacterium]